MKERMTRKECNSSVKLHGQHYIVTRMCCLILLLLFVAIYIYIVSKEIL